MREKIWEKVRKVKSMEEDVKREERRRRRRGRNRGSGGEDSRGAERVRERVANKSLHVSNIPMNNKCV